MKIVKTLAMLALISVTATVCAAQAAPKPLKIGVILTLTGQLSNVGTAQLHGIKLYMAEHGDTVSGRKIKLFIKDDTGLAPQVAKRQAQQLIINEHVDILAGFDLTPNAFSVAPLATKAKVPMVVMNAATSSVTEKSPYIVRTSMTMAQGAWTMAQWAYDNGIRTVYMLAADYAPGHAAAKQFKQTFTKLGGEIVGEVFPPVTTPSYAAYLQRVEDTAPDALFTFVNPGSPMVALVKGIERRGLREAGIKVIGLGDMTEETSLDALGNAAAGIVTAFHYSTAHESPENQAFLKAYHEAYPDTRPNFIVVNAYDGMHLIYKALTKTGGDASVDTFMKAVKGMSWMSPRGPVKIDPETRDIIQNEYIRKLERVDGKLQNVEFAVYKQVKDPAKVEGGLKNVEFEVLKPELAPGGQK